MTMGVGEGAGTLGKFYYEASHMLTDSWGAKDEAVITGVAGGPNMERSRVRDPI
jgi:hypothetical protein